MTDLDRAALIAECDQIQAACRNLHAALNQVAAELAAPLPPPKTNTEPTPDSPRFNHGEADETRYALTLRIRSLRDGLRRHLYDDPDTALQRARWLRDAEHAYHKLGGTSYDCLPAVYRNPAEAWP